MFYLTNQSWIMKPMTLAEVMSDADSEVETDDDFADLKERLVLSLFLSNFH